MKETVNSVLHGVKLDLTVEFEVAAGISCGGWEQCEHDRVNRFLPDMDVIELGGGIGYISCFIHTKISPLRKHVVVECNKDWIPIIEHHKVINGCNFTVVNELYSSSGYNLKTIISKYNFGDYALVMDIEGAEVDLIMNEFDALKKCKIAIVEFHPSYDSVSVHKAYDTLMSGFVEVERCGCGNWVGVYNAR